ncbi:MAG TPA: hypothetical protein VHH90_04630 [Polyangia bacterium]|nr:hypothetical protein [Polyangia bacterium]
MILIVVLPACADASGSPPTSPPSRQASAKTGHLSDGRNEIAGTWYVNRDGERLTLTLTWDSGTGALAGTSLSEAAGATPNAVTEAAVDASGVLRFRVVESSGAVDHQVQTADGVLGGRYAVSASGAPSQPGDYVGRITGWRSETFENEARVWDISLDGHTQAVLRVDRASSGGTTFIGTLKPYALDGQLDEQPSEDVSVQQWDGQNLSFTRPAAPGAPTYTGVASGRVVSGTVSGDGGAPVAWSGTRVEVLTHGLGAKSAPEVADWQTRTRARLGLLAFGGNPRPATMQVSTLGLDDPIPVDGAIPDRDDDMSSWPQAYELYELSFNSSVPSPWGGQALTRQAHGYLAVPTTPAPAGGYPVAVAMNGHGGSAYDVFDPQGLYWYGDSFARRGFVVAAVDIGHRPLADRATIYSDYQDGDDPGTGNGTHPAIEEAGMSSDWEEDGERAWDVMRALDYALGRSDVNPKNVVAVGLSMGGEITDWVAAMDPRIGVAFATGNPSDLAVMRLHGNHPCWNWQRGDAREYYDPGDLNALVGARVLMRETGRVDYTYSNAAAPFATAKEVVRRAQPAFTAAGGQLIHYLHFDAHAFHVGEFCPAQDADDGVTVPTLQAPEAADPWSTTWASDAGTRMAAPSVFAFVPGMAAP